MAGRRRRTCWRKRKAGSSGWKKSENWAEHWNFAAISCLCRSRQNRAIFVWCRRIGDFIVNRNYSPRPSGWAIILLSAIVVALAGCGRKGGLDLPPTASSAAVAAPADTDAEEAGRPSVFNPYSGRHAPPAPPKGRKKPFLLDPPPNHRAPHESLPPFPTPAA